MYTHIGVRDCPKAWDWCAAAAIGTAAGVHFRRFDSELPFHFAASSVAAIASLTLA